jgi:predicted ribonuclease YlaK
MNKDIRFYDTCSLLICGEGLFNNDEKFIVSSITFQELERIKTANNKDSDIKYSARLLLHLFETHPDMYEVVIHQTDFEDYIKEMCLDVTDDTRILSDAIWYNNNKRVDEVIFVTNDLSLKHIANLFFGSDMIESIPEETDNYSGYKEISASDENLTEFYQKPELNHFNLHVGEYLIIRDMDDKVVDLRVWTGNDHRYLNYNDFNSNWFGKVKPYQNDIYQKLLFDSLSNNKITLIKGPAGSGKTFISLAYLMSKLEKGELDHIIVFCNTVATANSARLGFLPGTRDEKLLDSQIGNLLISKFSGRTGVEHLMSEEKLILLPMSDIRGYDTNGSRAGIYISEAQNLDRTLIKLALQRIGEDCICIIDGDEKTQVDDIHFAGINNGMKRVSKVYRGQDIYGEVELRNIYRSRIAQIAEYI